MIVEINNNNNNNNTKKNFVLAMSVDLMQLTDTTRDERDDPFTFTTHIAEKQLLAQSGE